MAPRLNHRSPSVQQLILNPRAERRLKMGHLWIYSNEVDTKRSPLKGLEPGEQCEILDSNGKGLGYALVNPNQLICGRLVSRKDPFTAKQLKRRLESALALRERYFPHPSYRMVYGDSDGLPGLVVDRFGDYLVVQVSSWGMERMLGDIVDALVALVKPSGILLRNDHQGRKVEELPEVCEVAHGEVPQMVPFEENGVALLAPVYQGQKTGWFYDHRDNRARLNQWVKGLNVLDLFSYAGGWGVQALAHGAAQVTCVDASGQALDWCEENAALNGRKDDLVTIQGKAVDAMKELINEGQRFDAIVLDPPAFIKRRKDQKSGEAAYRHINELALRLLEKNGLLVSASCSMHLESDTLLEILRGAGRHLEKNISIIGSGGQGADHPVHPAIPETRYLKAHFVHLAAGSNY
ncbi:class I SAM-dependent rRNA methyltransferase [Microbulbifer pacificus]|uniref:Class I SAM-dependent rRNA methyltransferase n=1 Tax=Microbulbifer pacificus TaxID=407164 RepID=A0AAU0MVZ6_9GAMM|nr:class I SAM-dependent rRNA methyltransferase [Microbulbifer pacificus]WOX03965.1 class I SAM-dependent rRNA methyltransferase [Microbulbifer pacificus]